MKKREFKIESTKYTVDVLGEKFGWTKIGQCNTIAEGKELARDWYAEHERLGDFE